MPPTISILMPTFNGEDFIEHQIESILEQTHADFEFIIIDDGSTDRTCAIVDGYASRDSRIRRLTASGNRGQNNRIAELIDAARGDFLCFADQDDIWNPTRNTILLDAIGDRPLAFGQSQLIDEAGAPRGVTILQALKLTPEKITPLRALIMPMASAHAMIARRDWLGKSALYGPLPFDWLWALEAMYSGGLAYADDAIVQHRIHTKNQSNGGLIVDRPEPRFSRGRLRTAFLAQLPARVQLWSALTYLSRSTAVSPSNRALFRALAAKCYTRWLSRWRKLSTDHDLRRDFETALRPLAGSDEDWRFFEEQLDLVTRPAFSPVSVARGFRRLWSED